MTFFSLLMFSLFELDPLDCPDRGADDAFLLTTVYENEVLRLYCDGVLHSETEMKLNILKSRLSIGEPYHDDSDLHSFEDGCIIGATVWNRALK